MVEYTIEPIAGSGVPGCETTPEGCSIPNELTVVVGSTIIFANTDNVAHTWLSGLGSDDDGGSVFNSSLVLPGQNYQWIPDTVGDQPWYCIIHPWITGNIIVVETGTAITVPEVIPKTVSETETEDHADEMALIQHRLNNVISEMNRLSSVILQLQTLLNSMMTVSPDPDMIPESIEANTFESYIAVNGTEFRSGDITATTVNGTEFGLGDVMQITALFSKDLVSGLTERYDGYIPTEDYDLLSTMTLVVKGHNGTSVHSVGTACLTQYVNDVLFIEYENVPQCIFNDDGTISGTIIISEQMLDGETHFSGTATNILRTIFIDRNGEHKSISENFSTAKFKIRP